LHASNVTRFDDAKLEHFSVKTKYFTENFSVINVKVFN